MKKEKNLFFNNKQQCNLVIILAGFIGLYFSGKWLFGELQYISIKREFNLDIPWFTEAPLILFLVGIFLISLMLTIAYLSDFNFKKFINTTDLKRILRVGVLFNISLVFLTFLVEGMNLSRDIAGFLIVVLVFISYRFGFKKGSINFIFFLISLLLISALFFLLFLYLRYDFV